MVTSGSGWLEWFRRLPRASVLVFCTVALAAVQAVLAALDAATAIRIAAAVLIAAVAVASELDKLHTRRLEEHEAELQAQQERQAAEAEWLRQVRTCLREWPAPRTDEVDPYVLGVVQSPLATGTPYPASACRPTLTATGMRWRASGCAREVCCCSSGHPPAVSPGPPTRWPAAALPGARCSRRWRRRDCAGPSTTWTSCPGWSHRCGSFSGWIGWTPSPLMGRRSRCCAGAGSAHRGCGWSPRSPPPATGPGPPRRLRSPLSSANR